MAGVRPVPAVTLFLSPFPMKNPELEAIAGRWWYYSVELALGWRTRGIYPDDMPMLPRMMMRKADLNGMDCLDIGSMEGLMPILMRRGGANRVLATDAVPHCLEKMRLLPEIYRVDFQFHAVGLMYDLAAKLRDFGGFDFINLSGVLYHVFSPMHVVAGLRPLLKKNGLMLISTNVVRRADYSMAFNRGGDFQSETNTFWYLSIPMLEYMVRYFNMTPIDCLYQPAAASEEAGAETQAGYLAVMCRANDDPGSAPPDPWAAQSWAQSWEYRGLCDQDLMRGQARSTIRYADGGPDPAGGIDLLARVAEGPDVVTAGIADSHVLTLDAFS